MAHPVVIALRSRAAVGITGDGAEKAVLKYGRSFVGIERPKGYRPRAPKNCYQNAGDLACTGRGQYVEGFAISGNTGACCQHAWITIDGVHAIDVTWRNAVQCHYFGIVFPAEVLATWMLKRGYWGLLDPVEDELLLDAGLSRAHSRAQRA